MDMGRAYRAQDLVTLIENTIEPDTWYDISTTGQGSITPYPPDQPKKLAVLQTRDVHKKIEKLAGRDAQSNLDIRLQSRPGSWW